MKIIPCLFTVFISSISSELVVKNMNSPTSKYFAYGSNLSQKRIHINNKSAVRAGIGKLKDFRLDFDHWSARWRGHAATIVPHENSTVWGAIWEIDNADIANLDKQEGVDSGVYKVLSVKVETPNGGDILCRSYALVSQPDFSPTLPSSRYPSKTYMNCIIEGAIESQLPDEYIEQLRRIPHNSYEGPPDHSV